MASSSAATVTEYLASLPKDRRDEIAAVRALVKKHLPPGYREGMQFGMICWFIPLEKSGDTYNGQPLGAAALAAQKHYNALYLMGAYMQPKATARLEAECRAKGRKLDMGKSCLRFGAASELPQKTIGEILEESTVERILEADAKAHPKKKTAAKRAMKSTRSKKKAPKK